MSEHFALTLVSGPAEEPVSLDDVKTFCRIDLDDTSQDSIVATLTTAARRRCESVTRRALVTQTWRLSLDRVPGLVFSTPDFPGWEYLRLGADGDPRVVRLPRPPLVSVTSVVYVDTAGATQTLDPARYQVDADTEPARLFPAYGLYWPEVRPQANAVRVTYVAGYGAAAAVPAELKLQLMRFVAHCFERRDQADQEYLDRLFDPFVTGNWW